MHALHTCLTKLFISLLSNNKYTETTIVTKALKTSDVAPLKPFMILPTFFKSIVSNTIFPISICSILFTIFCKFKLAKIESSGILLINSIALL